MKTTMKKLLSFVLVAVLLVSAIPFQASAATGSVNVNVKDCDDTVVWSGTPSINTFPTNVDAMLNRNKVDISGAEGGIDEIWSSSQQKYISSSDDISDGDTITIKMKGKAIGTDNETEEATEAAPTEASTKPEVQPITLKLLFNDDQDVSKTLTHKPSNGVSSTIADLLYYVYDANWADTYSFFRANNKRLGTTYEIDTEVLAGESINVRLKTKAQEVKPIDIIVKVDSSDNVVWTGSKVPANGTSSKVEDLLNYCWNKDWDDVYKFDHAWSHAQQKNVALSGSVDAGDTLYIMVKKLSTNNSGTGNSGTGNSGTTTNNKFPYKVYLHIFKDNKVDDPAKTIDITNGIALDGKVTLAEVKSVVKNYYTAKNSDGIGYDGMYMAKGNWVGNFVNDTKKYDTIEDTNEMRKEAEVHINVMITNANAKSSSSSNADTSNPKTGDTFTATMTIMTISASALVLVYFFNKKRALAK